MHKSKPQNFYKLSHINNKMHTKMFTLKKFKVNLLIIMCEIRIHIPLQTHHTTSTKAKTLVILDHKRNEASCTMTTTIGKVPTKFRASPHIRFSIAKKRMVRDNVDMGKHAKDVVHF